MNIFPNPSIDIVNINIELEKKQNIHLRISNSLGQTVINDSEFNTKLYNKQIELNKLASGIYILSISSNAIYIKESLIVID